MRSRFAVRVTGGQSAHGEQLTVAEVFGQTFEPPAHHHHVSRGEGESEFFRRSMQSATFAASAVIGLECVANIGKSGSCHLFRHTFATLLLENGCDIRYVQEMLGHSKLETTEVYTHVSIRALKEAHQKFHPAQLPQGNANDSPVSDAATAAVASSL